MGRYASRSGLRPDCITTDSHDFQPMPFATMQLHEGEIILAMPTFKNLDRTVAQFREWALSDLTSPTTKGMIAEYLVRCAIGHDHAPALDWDFVDIRTPKGNLEVKSSSALTVGPSPRPRKAKFGIEIKTPWDAATNDWAVLDKSRRHADVYVFCLHSQTNPHHADPIDTAQWAFWVVPSFILDRECGHGAKSVTPGRLTQIATSVPFRSLAEAVGSALDLAASSKEVV